MVNYCDLLIIILILLLLNDNLFKKEIIKLEKK